MPARELPKQFAPLDAVFLNFERKEIPLHIGSVAICDGPLPFDAFVAGIERKLEQLPRYRQRAVRPFLDMGLPTWQDDPKFDIRRHIFHVKLDAPGSEEQLRELAGRIFTRLLDRDKPLWEIHIVDGLAGGRSAIIAKVHHAMVDGVSGVGLLSVMFDTSPDTPPLPKRKRYRPKPTPDDATLFADALKNALPFTLDQLAGAQRNLAAYGMTLKHDPLATSSIQRLVGVLPQVLGPLERLPFNRPCSGERKVAWSEHSFTDARAIRTACGGTVNDVVLTVLTGAVMRYLKLHKESLRNRYYRIMVPVNLRQADDHGTLGNCVSILPVTLPLFIKDPIERLRQVAVQTEAMKHAHVAELIRAGISWLGALPPVLQALAGRLPLLSTPVPIVHMVATNVPGPQVPLYANGRRLLTLYPHVPAGWEVGMCLAIQSYDQKLFFGLTFDAQAAPDGERMKGFLDASFAELCKAAKVPGAEPAAGKKRATRKAKTQVQGVQAGPAAAAGGLI
jgi:WS/DGAT/MGAT family acyltransferase